MFVSEASSRLHIKADQDWHDIIPLFFYSISTQHIFTTIMNTLHETYTNRNQNSKYKL